MSNLLSVTRTQPVSEAAECGALIVAALDLILQFAP